jgi:hypothetical protein
MDPLARGISCRLAQGIEESWIESGDPREFVIKDGRAVGDDTVGLAKPTTRFMAKAAELTGTKADGGRGRRWRCTWLLTTTDGDGWCSRRRRWSNLANRHRALAANDVNGRYVRRGRGRRLVAKNTDECRADDYEGSEGTAPCCPCWFAVGHTSSEGCVVLPARMWFSICRRYVRCVESRECACVDRRGRALHGGGHPRWAASGSDRGGYRR